MSTVLSTPAPPPTLSFERLGLALVGAHRDWAPVEPHVHGSAVDIVPVDAPKRKARAPASTHYGVRHDSGQEPVRIIVLSRILKEKDSDLLHRAAASEHGALLLSGLQGVLLQRCKALHAGGGGASLLTDANMKTMFSLSGSTISHAHLYRTNLTLPSRLPVEHAQQAYRELLEAAASAQLTAAGRSVYGMLVPDEKIVPPGGDMGAVIRTVVDEIRLAMEHGGGGDHDSLSALDEDTGTDAASTSSRGSRSTRSASTAAFVPAPTVPPLGAVARDAGGRVVYVDLQDAGGDSLETLRTQLQTEAPTAAQLDRLTPINKQRILYDIPTNSAVAAAFTEWVRHAMSTPALVELLSSITVGAEVLLLGCQFIIPKVSIYDSGTVPQQAFHTDVGTEQEVIAFAMHVRGEPLGTLIDPDGTPAVRTPKLGRADTSIFAFDTGVVHAGPARAGMPVGYDPTRAFFLMASPTLAPELVAKHRRDNGLHRLPVRVRLWAEAGAQQTLASACLERIERRLSRRLEAVEEHSLFVGLGEALVPLPSGDGANRLRLLTGPLTDALTDAASAQMYASLVEVLRVTEAQATPSVAHVCERLVAATGAVAGIGMNDFLVA